MPESDTGDSLKSRQEVMIKIDVTYHEDTDHVFRDVQQDVSGRLKARPC